MDSVEQPRDAADPRPVPPKLEVDVIRAALEERLFQRQNQPVKLDRFVLIERAGAGGMGVVYRAHDPELQREIAVKLVRPASAGSTDAGERGMARLLREARAAARITHPNVVTVHEVGVTDGGLYVAMEYVRGVTLRRWCTQHERSWTAVLDMFIGAGQGLEAAHRVGVVHRDFKPDNVLVAEDGRARVVDFGLARATFEAETTADGSVPGTTPSATELSTRSGALLGTPVYMSPEQHCGGAVEPASDQFSYCVALWEALWGQRPYPELDIDGLREAVAAGTRQRPRNMRGAPHGVLVALERGLDPDPRRRFPSMGALLARLKRFRAAPRRARQRLFVGAGLVVAASGGALAYAHALAPPGAERQCDGADALRGGVWNQARRTAIQVRFEQTALPFADDASARTVEILDRYADDWAAMHTEACEATWTRGEQSDSLLDRRMTCLRRSLSELDAYAGQLAQARPELVRRAVAGAEALPPLSRCADADRLLAIAAPPQDPARRRVLEEVDAQLAQARALELAGRYPDALRVAESAALVATLGRHPPVEADAWNSVGHLREISGREDAELALELAFVAALRGHDDAEAVRAALGMMPALDKQEGRRDEAAAWNERARALIDRMGGEVRLEARRIEELGRITLNAGDVKGAVRLYERAIALANAGHTTELERATAKARLAKAQVRAGAYDAAETRLNEALEIYEAMLGRAHPRLAELYSELGVIAGRRGDPALAYKRFSRAVELLEASLGEHEQTAAGRANLGTAARHLGRPDEARQQMDLALEMFERTLGPDSRRVAGLLSNLGNLASSQGQSEAAIAYYERALDHPDNPHRDYALEGLARVFQARGEYDRALALLRECLQHREQVGSADLAIQSRMHIASVLLDAERLEASVVAHRGALAAMEDAGLDEHIHRADAHFGIGEALVQLGRHRDAIAPLEQSLKIRAGSPTPRPTESAKAELRLAQALKATGGDTDRVAALARRAAEAFARDPRADAEQVETAQRLAASGR